MDYHILEQSKKLDSVRVAFHINIPGTSNFAGVSWQLALKQSRSPVTQITFLSAPEVTQISDGEVFEIIKTVVFSANLTKVQKRDVIEAEWMAMQASILAELQNELDFWGFEGTVT